MVVVSFLCWLFCCRCDDAYLLNVDGVMFVFGELLSCCYCLGFGFVLGFVLLFIGVLVVA